MIPLPRNAALLVVDVQQAFDDPAWGSRNNPGAERRIADLLSAWRARAMPIIHIRHRNPAPGSLFNPEAPGLPAKPEAEALPTEPILYKRVNSGFIGTDLEVRLRAQIIETVIIVGITTDHCCSTTARMAANLDFKVVFISDATFTFDRIAHTGEHYTAQEMHNTALASLNGEFATVLTTDQLLALLPSATP